MFLHPLGLLALLGVPAVALLHLFRRRFRPQRVSALFLWIEDDDNPLAGRRRERLRANASFWCEILAALLVGLAFAGPAGCGSGTAEHLVCVLDASASMGAIDLGGAPLRDRAVDVVRERIGALPAGSKVTLLASGTRPSLLAGPAAFPAEARAALAGYRPGVARHDLSPAVALGLQFSGDGAVLVVTDRFEPGAFPPEVELVAIGEALPNVAITHAARSREMGEDGREADRVLVTVTALTPPGTAPVRRELSITAGSEEIERRTLDLEPEQRRHFAFEVPVGTGAVVVALELDALSIDDRAYLAPSPPRMLSIASTLRPPVARSLGLASGASPSLIDRMLELVPYVEEVSEPHDAHLLLGHGERGGRRTWTLSIEGDLALDAEPEDLIGPFLAERRHPLLVGVTLEGILWSAPPSVALEGVPVVSAGDRPLLTETSDDTSRHFHLGLDPYRSTLQRSPDWPILLANLAEMRRAELSGARSTNVAVGDAFVFHGDDPARYRVEPLVLARAGAAESREVPARDVLVLEDLDAPGIYSLLREGREVARFGVSFRDAEESDLRGLASGERGPEVDLSTTLASLGPLETVLLAGALFLVVLDWWVLMGMRRRTQPLLAGGGA